MLLSNIFFYFQFNEQVLSSSLVSSSTNNQAAIATVVRGSPPITTASFRTNLTPGISGQMGTPVGGPVATQITANQISGGDIISFTAGQVKRQNEDGSDDHVLKRVKIQEDV